MREATNQVQSVGPVLAVTKHRIELEKQRLAERLERAISEGKEDIAKELLHSLLEINRCQRTLFLSEAGEQSGRQHLMYTTPGWFLVECKRLLTLDNREAMLYITGFEWGRLKALDRHLSLSYSEQSVCGVTADHESIKRAMSDLKRSGQRLLGWFHSHPGASKLATLPSAIDLNFQHDLERGGYEAIGGIFTRDGYVRFFSKDTEFEIEVVGSEAHKCEENVYQLV